MKKEIKDESAFFKLLVTISTSVLVAGTFAIISTLLSMFLFWTVYLNDNVWWFIRIVFIAFFLTTFMNGCKKYF
jgi:hypothetical protein